MSTLGEEQHQTAHIVFICSHRHPVDITFDERLPKHTLSLAPIVGMSLAQLLARSVDISLVAGFGITHLEQSYIGQLFGTRVIDLYRGDVVFLAGYLQLLSKSLRV